jgi:hypothetical protein
LAQQLQEIHEIQVDVDYLLKLYGSWRLNEVMYYDEGCTSPIGTGLFLEPGFMEHSCRYEIIFKDTIYIVNVMS